jgi:hypothetical protein
MTDRKQKKEFLSTMGTLYAEDEAASPVNQLRFGEYS